MRPTDAFQVYVNDMILVELSRPRPIAPDDLVRKLWDGAKFDYYLKTKDPSPILDWQGNPLDEVREYTLIISDAKMKYMQSIKGMTN